jgi:hypothetical protein
MFKVKISKVLKFLFPIVIAMASVMFCIETLTPQSTNMKDRFYIGPFNFYFKEDLRTPFYTSVYESLSYNTMQSYGAHLDTIPLLQFPNHNYDAGFFDTLSFYTNFTNTILDNWKTTANNQNAHSLVIEREKILRAAYGQRSTYEAENISIIPRYYYSTHGTGDANYTDVNYGNRHVVYCSKQNNDQPGYAVQHLIENGEQCNQSILFDSSENSSGRSLFSDIKKNNYKYKWYIKPCIRIDSNYAKQNFDTLVARIEISCYNGVTKNIDLKCWNFLDQNNNYNGNYLEVFNNLDSFPSQIYKLSIPALELAYYIGDDSVKYRSIENKTDYRVYWYGKVDFWLDYVRVDDEWAHFLFTDSLDNHPKNKWKFHTRIQEEVEAFGSNGGLGYFYVDEFGYNNIPCLAEVNRLIKLYSGNTMSLLLITDRIAFMGWPAFRASNLYTIVDHAN